MKILFALFLCIDAIILLVLGYEGFVVKSNKRRMYQRRFTGLFTLIVAALLMSFYRFNLALWLAGTPAVGVSLFVFLFFLAMVTHKGPWN